MFGVVVVCVRAEPRDHGATSMLTGTKEHFSWLHGKYEKLQSDKLSIKRELQDLRSRLRDVIEKELSVPGKVLQGAMKSAPAKEVAKAAHDLKQKLVSNADEQRMVHEQLKDIARMYNVELQPHYTMPFERSGQGVSVSGSGSKRPALVTGGVVTRETEFESDLNITCEWKDMTIGQQRLWMSSFQASALYKATLQSYFEMKREALAWQRRATLGLS